MRGLAIATLFLGLCLIQHESNISERRAWLWRAAWFFWPHGFSFGLAPEMAERWPADKVSRRPVAQLVPAARNARIHSDEQVTQLAAAIEEWGWTIPVLVDEAGGIIAGHGRILAAHRLGIEDVPVMIAAGWTDAKKRAYEF